jgi:response regulator RpfG family c-di-GMP phosphodiesterase
MMSAWALLTVGVTGWVAVSALVVSAIARAGGASSTVAAPPSPSPASRTIEEPVLGRAVASTTRVLVVDDDPGLRTLLRASFEVAHIDVDEADGAGAAAAAIAGRRPDVIVLDVGMPGVDGITFCRSLKADPHTRSIPVVLLTGSEVGAAAEEAGADGFVRKPFSPLVLLHTIESLTAGSPGRSLQQPVAASDDAQLLLYAQDFSRLLEIERGQRLLLQQAYRETAVALARALESKDGHTAAHCERVRRYASQLAAAADADLLRETGLEFGFILHDVGKIGIPDAVLAKAGPLTDRERSVLQTHPLLGHQMVGQAALLRGSGAEVVRSHHERWDGRGYPDGLSGDAIPLSARVFAIADALDAITSHRPYRAARGWEDAVGAITREAGKQFDPELVHLFRERQDDLRAIYYEVSQN